MRGHFVITSFLVLAAVVGSSARADDRRADPSRLVIMTFNAHHLWDGVEPEEGALSFPWKHSPTKADAHMADIAAVIRRHDPDVINLIEVENLDALERLNDRFLRGRGYKPYLVQGKDTATGQDVGLLSRIDPIEMFRWDARGRSGEISSGVSKNYIARIEVGELKVAFISAHLLAHPLDQSRRHRRQAQAEAIREAAVEQAEAGYLVVVWGDLNDYDAADRDHVASKPITDVLARLRGMSPSTEQDDLMNVISRVDTPLRYTAVWDRNRNGQVEGREELTAIDHVLVSPELGRRIVKVEIDQSHDPFKVSDHFPIVVTFVLNPAR